MAFFILPSPTWLPHVSLILSLSLFILFLSLLVSLSSSASFLFLHGDVDDGDCPPARTLVVVGTSFARPQLGFLQFGALGEGLFAQYSKNFILKGISGFGEESKLACSRDNVAVYRAVLPGDLDVVIKTQNCPRTMMSIEELRRLKHPNVLPLLGFCMAGKFPLYQHRDGVCPSEYHLLQLSTRIIRSVEEMEGVFVWSLTQRTTAMSESDSPSFPA